MRFGAMTIEDIASYTYCAALTDEPCLCGWHSDGEKTPHISGAIYPAVETAYDRTVDHGFNIRIF